MVKWSIEERGDSFRWLETCLQLLLFFCPLSTLPWNIRNSTTLTYCFMQMNTEEQNKCAYNAYKRKIALDHHHQQQQHLRPVSWISRFCWTITNSARNYNTIYSWIYSSYLLIIYFFLLSFCVAGRFTTLSALSE